MVLISLGITVFTKLRPIDILLHLINSSQDMRVFSEFFDKFGRDQSCAMCLAIACSHSSINYAKYDSVLPQLTSHTTNMATKLYFELGGKPGSGVGMDKLKSRKNFTFYAIAFGISENAGLLGIPVTGFEISFSAKHNGLALFISRIVRHVWGKRITKSS